MPARIRVDRARVEGARFTPAITVDPRAELNPLLVLAAQRLAAKLWPRVILPRIVASKASRMAEARGRQLQRLVRRLLHHHGRNSDPKGGQPGCRAKVARIYEPQSTV